MSLHTPVLQIFSCVEVSSPNCHVVGHNTIEAVIGWQHHKGHSLTVDLARLFHTHLRACSLYLLYVCTSTYTASVPCKEIAALSVQRQSCH
eukprot:m.65788 g.65788  ORF g.65788 m.65788 type:complete len:91 (+) comp12074_c0_seq2:327-599(+)